MNSRSGSASRDDETASRPGRVFLVGAGPGAPDLLTLRGAELLGSADVVVYDALVSQEILRLIPQSAECINVGKRGHDAPTRSQAGIEELLVDRARAGERVVRLKGGDPFVFGRGGEEVSACRAAGIPCEIVPGVTAAAAAPAAAGIPLTDRRYAASFAVVTGHNDPTKVREALRWEELGRGADTLVILMGVRNLRQITARLIAGGRAASTPSAAIRYGTLPGQQVVVAPLGELAAEIEAAGLTSPAVIVVGDVVRLRAENGSAEDLPLFGRRVLLTRPAASAASWALAFRDAGALPVVVPMIRIESLPPSSEIDAVLADLAGFDALLFASANGARQLALQLRGRGIAPRDLAIPAHCVGPATAVAARDEAFSLGELPDARYDAEGLADHLIEKDLVVGKKLLLSQPVQGRRVLADRLREAGASVQELAIYRTVPESFDSPELAASLAAGALDALVFASPSAVRSFATGLGDDLAEVRDIDVVALGAATADALREIGLPATLEPTSATVDQCIQALTRAKRAAPAHGPEGERE
ncbi:MAG: uroporphyrinogen-III C-methyltransferase [bacterium]|nr:uroporphyrinogen-III C-methyltransferase [bacterium]